MQKSQLLIGFLIFGALVLADPLEEVFRAHASAWSGRQSKTLEGLGDAIIHSERAIIRGDVRILPLEYFPAEQSLLDSIESLCFKNEAVHVCVTDDPQTFNPHQFLARYSSRKMGDFHTTVKWKKE